MSRAPSTITIYTDGGCRPNPGPGGWGAVLLVDDQPPRELSGGETTSTNNRMELTAAIEALRALAEPHQVDLVTDSQYLRQGITRWIEGWRATGWRTAAGDDVKNRDLWEALDAEIGRHDIRWRWTRGHAGDRWNERADRLASASIPREPLPVDDPEAVHLFTAVAWSGKAKRGGWAVVLVFGEHEKHLSGTLAGASANRMHLVGAVSGLEGLTRSVRVHVYTASDYLKDGATSWTRTWKARGWRTADDRPVAHRDLWQRLDRLQRRHRVQWHVAERDHLPAELENAKKMAREALTAPQ